MARAAAESARAWRGRTIGGNWRAEREAGQIGMWSLYEARQISLEREILLAIATLDERDFEATSARLRRACALRHPAIAGISDFGRDLGSGATYVVTEPPRGERASSVITRLLFEQGLALWIGYHALGALAEAHAAGVTHGALSTDRIWLEARADGSVGVLIEGFGLASGATEHQDVSALGGALRDLLLENETLMSGAGATLEIDRPVLDLLERLCDPRGDDNDGALRARAAIEGLLSGPIGWPRFSASGGLDERLAPFTRPAPGPPEPRTQVHRLGSRPIAAEAGERKRDGVVAATTRESGGAARPGALEKPLAAGATRVDISAFPSFAGERTAPNRLALPTREAEAPSPADDTLPEPRAPRFPTYDEETEPGRDALVDTSAEADFFAESTSAYHMLLAKRREREGVSTSREYLLAPIVLAVAALVGLAIYFFVASDEPDPMPQRAAERLAPVPLEPAPPHAESLSGAEEEGALEFTLEEGW